MIDKTPIRLNIKGPLISQKEVQGKMANQVGKRYVCKKCGAEFIVTRGGNGTVHCCGKPVELKK